MDNFGSGLLAYDLFHSKLLVSAFSVLSGALPSLSTLIIVFFLVQSVALCFLTDNAYSKWVVRVLLGVVIANLALGGALMDPAQIFSRAKSPVNMSVNVDKIFTFRQPGEGAQIQKIDAYGSTPFETFAYAGVGDEAFATGVGENLAAAQTFKKNEITTYVLTDKIASQRDDIEFDESWKAMSSQMSKTPILSSFITYISNSMTSVAYASAKMAEGDVIGEAFQNKIAPYIDWFAKTSIQPGADDGLYASNYVSSSAEVIAPTISTFPGGPTAYGGYMWSHANDPSLATTSKIADAQEIVDATKEGRSPQSFGPAAPNNPKSYASKAAAAGYNAQESGVDGAYAVRTQNQLLNERCMNSPTANPKSNDLSADVAAATRATQNRVSAKSLDPCRLTLPKEVRSALSGLTGSASNAGVGRTANQLVKNIFAPLERLINSTGATSQLIGAVGKISGWNLPMANSRKCMRNPTYRDVIREYDKMLAKDLKDMKTSEKLTVPCQKMARNQAYLQSAISETALDSSAIYEDYLYSDSALALESSAVFAASIDLLPSSEPSSTENMATLSNGLRALLEPMADGYKFVPETTKVAPPTNVETSYVGEKLEAIKDGAEGHLGTVTGLTAAGAVTAAKVVKSRKSIWSAFKSITEVGSKMKAAIQGIAGIGKIIKAGFSWMGKLFGLLISLVPMVSILMLFTFMYYLILFSTSLGMAFLPLWSLFTLGKVFTGASSGDEQYGGVSFFPIATLIAAPIIMGAELIGLGFASGQVLKFFSNLDEFMVQMLAGLGAALVNSIAGGFTDSAITYPMSFFNTALKPIGLMFGVSMLPTMFMKITRASPYEPKLNESSANRIESIQPNTTAAATIAGMGLGNSMQTSGGGDGVTTAGSGEKKGVGDTIGENLDTAGKKSEAT